MPFALLVLIGCDSEKPEEVTAAPLAATEAPAVKEFDYAFMTDALHAAVEADRTAYTRLVVNRLTLEEKVITASEHWEDDKALLLPAQMFRAGAELAREKNEKVNYSLLSQWPINKQNKPKTPIEEEGLKFIAENPGENFYGEETLGDKTYFTGIYPDMAVAEACIKCHNEHVDSPRTDFEMGDVMGGVVIRVEKQ